MNGHESLAMAVDGMKDLCTDEHRVVLVYAGIFIAGFLFVSTGLAYEGFSTSHG